MSERTMLLLQYLDSLTRLQQGGYVCHREISNCIEEIEGLLITKEKTHTSFKSDK